MSIFNYSLFYFTIESNNECRVGSDSNVFGNGAIKGTELSGKIVIPHVAFDENHTSYLVRGIGRLAFQNTKINEV